MHDPHVFRARLARRILGVLSIAGAYACASSSSGRSSSSGASSGASSGSPGSLASSGSSGSGITDAGASGAGGGAVTPSSSDSSSGAGGTGGRPPITACLPWPPDAGAGDEGGPFLAAPEGCPTDLDAAENDFLNLLCPTGWEPYKVVGGPTDASTTECCYYQVYDVLCGPGGRPFKMAGKDVVAPLASSTPSGALAPTMNEDRGWGLPGKHKAGDEARVEGLSADDRRALTEAWAQDGSMEHASVASFSRFSLALMAFGAPSELVTLTHRAALDEIDHARACFALASRYAGEPIAPGRFPFDGGVQVEPDLAALAVTTLIEGCLGETLAAVIASERLTGATDPGVRATLGRIAEDEARHAELAWKTVAWAIGRGGEPVRAAVATALARCRLSVPEDAAPRDEARSRALEAHGIASAAVVAEAVRRAWSAVIEPAARAVLTPGIGVV